jgi:hypothetical protein
MRWLVWLSMAAGCAVDPCAPFSGQTCIAVEVTGPAALQIDQLLVSAFGAFTLSQSPSPPQPRATPAAPPLAIAVLPGELDGAFELSLSARLQGAEVAAGQSGGTLTHGHTVRIALPLATAGADLAGLGDLAGPIDLARRDFGGSCDPVTQSPCGAGAKCVFIATPSCVGDGAKAVGQLCTTAPADDCQRTTQCLFPGDPVPGNGLCEQICAGDSDCHQPPVSVGGTSLPANAPHCLFAAAGASGPLYCSVACNPVSHQGASGCPTGSVCVYGSNGKFPEFTFCDRAGTGTDGQPCDGNFRCAPGFNCVQIAQTTRCRALCRANNSLDCTGGTICQPGAGGSPPMFGYCCPGGGC